MDATRQAPATRGGAIPDAATPVDAKSKRRPVVRLALIALAVVALLVAIVYGVKFIGYASTHETTDDATIDADEVQLTSKIAERVDRITVDTNQLVRRGELIIKLDDVEERDRLNQATAAYQAQQAQARAADANVALTRATQQAQNQQASGGIEQARASISSAAQNANSTADQIAVSQAGADAARAQLKVAQDAIPGALQNLRRADADLRRTQSLVSTGDFAASQLDTQRANYEAARSQYAQARASVGAADAQLAQAEQRVVAQRSASAGSTAQVGVQQAQLTTAQGRLAESDAPSRVAASQAQADAARAQAASLRSQVLTARDNLGYTRIYSPINAYVGQKNVEIGQTVAPGESLMTLIPSNASYITANFKETQIGKMRVGQEVDINVDAYKGVKFIGHVDNLSPASQNKFSLVPAQNATGNFVKVTQRLPVRIMFDRVEGGRLGDYPLRPGMSVETSVKVK